MNIYIQLNFETSSSGGERGCSGVRCTTNNRREFCKSRVRSVGYTRNVMLYRYMRRKG